MKNSILLTLKGYKRNGKSNTLDYTPKGDIKNVSFEANLIYTPKVKGKKGVSEFHNYLRYIHFHNFIKVDITGAHEGATGNWKECEIPEDAILDLKETVGDIIKKTPDQIRLEQVEAKLEKAMALLGQKEGKSEISMETAIEMYQEAFDGKKPHHKKSVENILKEINNKE